VDRTLNAGHFIALIAALALLLLTAMDWYSTEQGRTARELQESSQPQEGQPQRLQEFNEQARETAEAAEKNAWQVSSAFDRVLLVVVVGAALLSLLSVILAAAGRPSGTLAGVGLTLAVLGTLMLTFRLVQEPGLDAATTVEPGAPLALVALGLLALGGSMTLREPRPPEADAEAPVSEPAAPPAR
jgi:hypothetical protein